MRKETERESHSRYSIPGQIIVRGEFAGTAHWLTNAGRPEPTQHPISPQRPMPAVGIVARDEDPAEGNSELGALLDAIAEDVHGRAQAARASIRADFAARINHVRKHVSGAARAAAIAALGEARKAALSIVKQNAALELAGRKKVAIEASRSKKINKLVWPSNNRNL